MNKLLTVSVLSSLLFVCGCASVETSRPSERLEVVPPAELASASTVDLTSRRARLYEMILEIQHEVELKAGLPMGVSMSDERTKLAELYLEARQIDRELLRRWREGDGEAHVETVKANL